MVTTQFTIIFRKPEGKNFLEAEIHRADLYRGPFEEFPNGTDHSSECNIINPVDAGTLKRVLNHYLEEGWS